MKTTLVIDDGVFRRLSIEAAQQGRTISELVEAALRLMLESAPPESSNLQPLPITTDLRRGWSLGGHREPGRALQADGRVGMDEQCSLSTPTS